MRSLIKIFSVVGILFLTTSGWAQTNTFPSSGKVGVGTVSPSELLTVYGSETVYKFGNRNIQLNTHDPTNWDRFPWIGWYNNGVRGLYMGYGNPGQYVDMRLENGNNLAIRGGNVGIGTDSPTERLSVNGTTKTKEVIVTDQAGDWPDYVFADPGYQLPNLGEIETYINKYKHLPGIPTKDEIEKEGQFLGAIQKELLKKIEELTLYTIDQQKRIEALEEELKQLHNKK